MNDGAQLSLFDLGPATTTSAAREAARVAGIVEKVDTEDFRDAFDLYTPDFEEE